MALPVLLTKVGLPLIIEALGAALGRIDNPVAQTASKTLNETHIALQNGMITPEAAAEANRHLERMTELAQEDQQAALGQVNESLRAEVASTDPYVRRMRPTFGYLMAVTWTVQMLALAYVIIFKTEDASVVVDAVESLSAIWTVALSVLGIYVYKRSEEKKITYVQEAAQKTTVSVPVPARKPAVKPQFNN